ncbi:MAG: CDP-diacylglycerol--glycerol-3-phosphate 3-phosphatidyltransferase [Gomphosphaeria aponina SAG 52.96 = DSM 107014]|uniref:CDP-diacylglycerol--glycerol-3-phosphate 3-phosphatidyltransferase n=1 Tax=Gomphosphaeria aponina SAG 52.96 = DSM 107014 TaxID=1521640 RepID=A0A941GWV4_9CHRO|nr:CDP-diacylglycerol--glycerol-3-phosphate 3-phosphatidyltransferase [Gomphosphaeria aponina SAG 52.96 = DSM 107014]
MNLPTWITVSRLLVLPIILYLLHEPTKVKLWSSLGIFLLGASTDWLDGYLARKLNQVTELGKFLDPLVDKLLVLGPLLALIELGKVPAWGVFLILARELAIAGWRINPQLAGDSSIKGANIWGKGKTVTQIGAIALLIAPLPPNWHTPALIFFWVSVAVTLISGLIYIFPNISSSTEKSMAA